MEKLLTIDLNADLGEESPHETDVMPFISSANIACGGHAGSDEAMRQSLRQSAQFGVAAGAHPGYPDPQHFGRRSLNLTAPLIAEIAASVAQQLQVLSALANAEGVPLQHVKPHGALYNQAAQHEALAQALVQVVAQVGFTRLYTLAGEHALSRAARACGLDVIGEGFADRGYAVDGTLWPRQEAGALLTAADAVAQGVQLATRQQVRAVTGEIVPVVAQTLCLHGDGPSATALARELRRALLAAGVEVRALGTGKS